MDRHRDVFLSGQSKSKYILVSWLMAHLFSILLTLKKGGDIQPVSPVCENGSPFSILLTLRKGGDIQPASSYA